MCLLRCGIAFDDFAKAYVAGEVDGAAQAGEDEGKGVADGFDAELDTFGDEPVDDGNGESHKDGDAGVFKDEGGPEPGEKAGEEEKGQGEEESDADNDGELGDVTDGAQALGDVLGPENRRNDDNEGWKKADQDKEDATDVGDEGHFADQDDEKGEKCPKDKPDGSNADEGDEGSNGVARSAAGAVDGHV